MASQFVRKITDTTTSEPIKETTTSGDFIVTKDNKVLINLNGTLKDLTPVLTADEFNTLKTSIKKNADDIVTANTAIKKNTDDIKTANTNIKKNTDDITQLKADIEALKPTE